MYVWTHMSTTMLDLLLPFVNPRLRACAARVIAVGLSVCVCERETWTYFQLGGNFTVQYIISWNFPNVYLEMCTK